MNEKKILAIIPARAGSKGIPNKNIRLLNGHPLIYYSIQNALKSKFITDIIVTTDSPEVRIIAEQMGVSCKQRSKELCDDSVTLDSVIFDAIPKNIFWDYVITMQPTSPTLKVETLDNAIQYTITNEFDTVISAVNKPHLSWTDKEGKKIPNYSKRLNRQFLPPCYIETGAFLISKFICISKDNRIGPNVGIYELCENESYDIDTFYDLRNAEAALNNQQVGIYVNGNNQRGVGHIYRALEVADEFLVKPDIYYDINQTNPKIFGTTTHNLIGINGIADLFERCKSKPYTLFINDILSTSIDYMIGLRSVLPHAKVVNFEDDGEGATKADLVFNALLGQTDLPNEYSGEKYYISPKIFMLYKPIEIKKQVKKIFISFGGADPQNYSDRLLNIITQEKYKTYDFIVVLGRAKENVQSLLQFNKKNIEVLYNVSNMPALMVQCDVGITSRGRTGYELAMLGIPSIAMAQNHREEKHDFVCNENGFTYIGLNPTDEIIEATLDMYLKLSSTSRKRFQDMLLSHDLRNGRRRIMDLVNAL